MPRSLQMLLQRNTYVHSAERVNSSMVLNDGAYGWKILTQRI